MSYHWGNPYQQIEAGLFFTRVGLNNVAALNSMAAAFSTHTPMLSRYFQANAASARLLGHAPQAPEFNITQTEHNGQTYDVEEEDTLTLPHATLKRFHKVGLDEDQPKVLVLAPLSGHPATLLKPTVEEMLHDHDVYIADWHDPRNVPLDNGSFDLNDYISYITKFFDHIGPDAHVIAVCQPGVPLVAALSAMEEEQNPNLPLSATFKGSPLDTSISPTEVNQSPQKLVDIFGSKEAAVQGFVDHMIHPISAQYIGRGQPVYHGQMQLLGFYGLAPDDHAKAYMKHWENVASGQNPDAVARHEEFYKDYNHVMDLPGGYLAQTMDAAFLNQRLTDGTMVYTNPETGHMHIVDPANIENTALFVVEGEGDTITGLGQTAALLAMATNLDPDFKRYRRSPKGHYGLFAGGDYRDHTAAETRGFIREIAETARQIDHAPTHKEVRAPGRFSIDQHPELLEAPRYAELRR